MFNDSGYSSPTTSYYSEEYEEEFNKRPRISDEYEEDYYKRQKLSNYEACPICKQNILDPNLKIFEGPPPSALEEEAALTDERLRLYNDGELMPDIDSLPQNKITQFEVFDREGHLCPFDNGLIENDQLIYFSGYIKPVYDEDASGENGVPAQELGPISQWWISGYDGGENFLIAFLTPYAEYILMEPSEKYKEFMKSPKQKALLAKIVIEFLSNSYEPVYEELLNRIQEVTMPEGIEPFDEDSLAEHAQFITDQVSEIDDDGELLSTPAMDTIINLFGVTVKKRKKCKKGMSRNLKLTEATMTPLVSKIFEEFFDNNERYFSYTRKNGSKESMNLPNSPDLKKLSSVQWEEGSDSAVVNGETISIGDFVYISSRDPSKRNRIFKIEYFFQRNLTKQVHCSEFCRGVDTILEEASSPQEFFMLSECSDWSIFKIIQKVEIVILRDGKNLIDHQFGKIFFVQKRYFPAHGKFEDLPENEINSCWVCSENLKDAKNSTAYFSKGIVKYKNENYYPGCCVLVEPFAITFDAQKKDTKIEKKIMTLTADEIVYPEIYRKAKEVSIVDESPEPFKIAYIKKIFEKNIKNRKKIFLTVNKFYRPENTQIIDNKNDKFYDLQLLFWSDEEIDIEIENVKGRCNVFYSETAPEFDSFYYNESYNYEDKSFGKAREVFLETELKESVVRKLRTLNPFSGCGGLAEGLTQSGVADIKYGIDIDAPTSNAFKMNFPKAKVFNMDCNLVLKDLLSGDLGEYPKKGDVEMLIGGPPCQGFSTMNRFTSQQYSQFKNSLIVTYLSYCDYYRPKYFVLENVKNFICFKKSVLLKHVLGCLVAMGYQCTFGVLQGGNYGLPQTRRRLFIMAAAPGNPLPKFPNPTHAFFRQLCGYEIEIVGKQFVPDFRTDSYHSAPFRMNTIRDALHDLPSLGKSSTIKSTSYQKFIKSPNVPITEHICKDISPLNEARIKHIPAEKDCDWRDLPNISVRLRDGTYTKILKYTHHDRKNGKSKCGLFRGVCACASGKSCESSLHQNNTLIPWCLSHTANRNNNWSGLYGRLDWDGCFSTTITNPEPSCKQGRVLHPQEDRIVSVRECARSQGLPDYFKFYGTVMEKYRQVGNAVPPPMARALGYEIKKCIERL